METRADVIEQKLKVGVKDVKELASEVLKQRPEDNYRKILSQCRAVLKDIESGKGRWNKYNLNTTGVLKVVEK